ncbi:hypothetical protein AC578_216 [Pseudocercospora eumusae]|uniref:Uncharacterized protein n=1 Tax=Pseudocercospora eumusae TaxID=321146 RepID=A0A139HIZ6_9PEZI|nr:hypothetical protein AC578_216 [Pseudocercospora eumusae]
MDGSQQTSLMLPFGICFGLLAGTIASLVFVIGLVVGSLSTAMYLVRFKTWLGTKAAPKGNSYQSKCYYKDLSDSHLIPSPPPIGGIVPDTTVDPFPPWPKPDFREPDTGADTKSFHDFCGTRRPSLGPYGDPFAGIGLPRARPKKKQADYPWKYPDDTQPAGDLAIPKTPENEVFDPFSNLGRDCGTTSLKPKGPLGSKPFADLDRYPPLSGGIKPFPNVETYAPPPAPPPPAQPEGGFMHDPFANLKPPPPMPESFLSDPFADIGVGKIRKKNSITSSRSGHQECCCCCEKKAKHSRSSDEDDDGSTISSKTSLTTEDKDLEIVDAVPKIKVLPDLGNLSDVHASVKEIFTPPSTVEAADIVPSPPSPVADQKIDDRKKLINDVVQTLQALLQEVQER